MNKLSLLAAAFLLSIGSAAQAQDYIVLDRTADDFDRVVVEPDGTTRVYDAISRETRVPVVILEQQRASSHLGYGGLLIANSLAAETGRPFDEIIALRQSGRGWGQIGQQYGVQLGPIVSRAQRADPYFRHDGKLTHDEKKAEKFVNGHDARDGKWDGTGPGNGHGHGHGHAKAAKAQKHGGRGHGNDEGDEKGKGKGHGKH